MSSPPQPLVVLFDPDTARGHRARQVRGESADCGLPWDRRDGLLDREVPHPGAEGKEDLLHRL